MGARSGIVIVMVISGSVDIHIPPSILPLPLSSGSGAGLRLRLRASSLFFSLACRRLPFSLRRLLLGFR